MVALTFLEVSFQQEVRAHEARKHHQQAGNLLVLVPKVTILYLLDIDGGRKNEVPSPSPSSFFFGVLLPYYTQLSIHTILELSIAFIL